MFRVEGLGFRVSGVLLRVKGFRFQPPSVARLDKSLLACGEVCRV